MRDKLKELGARAVFRSAGSKQEADLIAFFSRNHSEARYAPEAWLVQAKRDGKLPPAERKALIQLSEDVGAKAVLAKTGERGRGVVLERIGADSPFPEKTKTRSTRAGLL